MIRVLHFAGIINDNDFIDNVLRRLDRTRYTISTLVGSPPRRQGQYSALEHYPMRILNMPFKRSLYPRMLKELLAEIRRFRPHILQSHHYDEALVAMVAARIASVPCFVIGRHYSDHVYALTRGMKRRFFLGLEGLCNRAAHRIVVPAEEVSRLLIDRQRVPEGKVR